MQSFDDAPLRLHEAHCADTAARQLASRGYCCFDLLLGPEKLRQAREDVSEAECHRAARQLPDFVAEGLLGSDPPMLCGSLGGAASGTKEADEAMSQLGAWMAEESVTLGFEIDTRSPGFVHTSVSEQVGAPKPETLSEVEMSQWIATFELSALMAILSLGPDTLLLEMESLSIERPEVTKVLLSPGCALVLRVDALAVKRRRPVPPAAPDGMQGSRDIVLLSCFFNSSSTRTRLRRSLVQRPWLRTLHELTESRLEELKALSNEDERMKQVPRQWLLLMNRHFFQGHRMACYAFSARIPSTWDCTASHYAGLVSSDFLAEVPLVRFDWREFWDPDPRATRHYRTFAKHLGMVDGCELFDNRRFSISSAEVKMMDPQQRVVLENGYEALQRAGLTKGRVMNSLGGIYLGIGTGSDFAFVKLGDETGHQCSATGGSSSIAANRFSFCLGMKGPSISIDADDASALVALHLCCQDQSATDFSVVGGIKLHMAAYLWPQQQALGLLSQKGRCFSFDASADGFSHGDAAVSFVIKAFTATVDGAATSGFEEPYLSVISATAINSSGRSSALGSPHGPSLQEVISITVQAAGLSGFDVDLVDCGTGSALSDAVEASALLRRLRILDLDVEPLVLTASKSSGGNSCHASGAVSLLRVMLSHSYSVIPPCCHLSELNELIPKHGELCFPTEMLMHRMPSSYCGVSARGLAGSNAHAICFGSRQICED